MSPHLPDGDPAPEDGTLPNAALKGLAARPFGIYVHVPYCRVRCGYCDFNTYTPAELGGTWDGPDGYLAALHAEFDLATRVLGPHAPAVSTVFLGGGTPTLLPDPDLRDILSGIGQRWGLHPDAEVTTEANPDTMTPQRAVRLAEAGYTRVSLGMQSAVPHVLATLDRTHDPAGVSRAVAAVRGAGLGVSLDLIYGTPGESMADWETSLRTALDLEPDHLSAYALTVEPGTRLAARVRRGEIPGTDEDDLADKYELADDLLAGAGYAWYEVSNWARTPADACRHNLGYWRGDTWWGAGPGAHSHVGGVRWWNVKHPSRYAERLASGRSPAAAREELTDEQREQERIMLLVRLAEGLPVIGLTAAARHSVAGLMADGLVNATAALAGRIVLTRRGRLLTDTVVRALTGP